MNRLRWAALFWLVMSTAAFGWGQEGHSIVAEIAQRRLAPAAVQVVEQLLGRGHSLASVASWADDQRDARPDSYNWHFVDIPLDAADYQPARDCKPDPAKGDCVIAAIAREKLALRCGASDAAKAEALKYLVHFVGDVHQPLHTVGEAKGGNDIKVDLLMRGLTCTGSCVAQATSTNLHKAWDSDLILKVVWNWGAYVDRLEAGYLASTQAQGADGGTPVDWAIEAHAAAQQVWSAVPADRVLKDDYFQLATPILDRQLGNAGLRLARLLNETFADQSCPAH